MPDIPITNSAAERPHLPRSKAAALAQLATLDSFLAEARVYTSYSRDLARELAATDHLTIEVADRLNDIVDAYRSIRGFVTGARSAGKKDDKLPPPEPCVDIPPATPLGMQIARAVGARGMLAPTPFRAARMEVFRGAERHVIGLDPRRNEWECECSAYQHSGICEVMQEAYQRVLQPTGGRLRAPRYKPVASRSDLQC